MATTLTSLPCIPRILYKNYDSRKGGDLISNPRACVVFSGEPLHRSVLSFVEVRVEGSVEKVSSEESDHYFQSQPRGCQNGALVSAQSSIISGRDVLEKTNKKLNAKYSAGAFIPRPDHCRGIRLHPLVIEFWQGRESRLHDRGGGNLGLAIAWPLLLPLLWTSEASAMANHSFSTGPLPLSLQGAFLADLDPDTARLAINILGPLFAAFNLLFIVRIVMSWYPQLPVGKFPFVIAYAPTEPVLGPTRRLIPPVGGVDVSPVIWVALMSFGNEILLGQQGLLVLLSQQQP